MRRGHATLPSAVVAGAMVVSLVWLHALGHGDLGPPPWSEPSKLLDWIEAKGSLVAAFTLLRQAALVIGWYLVAATLLGWTARTLGLLSIQAVLDRATVPAVRRLVGSAAGAGLASIVVLGGAGAAGATPPRPGVAVIHQLDPEPVPTSMAPPPQASPIPAGTASMRRLDGPVRNDPGDAAVAAQAAVEMWTVSPGDSFWHIAELHLTDLNGSPPDERALTRYWLALIDANRAVLPDPFNPDLLFASTVLALPPV